MRIIILGAPGSGKGPKHNILLTVLVYPRYSTGQILRQSVKDGTPLGREVACVACKKAP